MKLTGAQRARDIRKKGIARLAYEAGKTRYFTGKPCKWGHVAERMIRNGVCAECLKVYAEKYARKHPETHQKAKAKHHILHLEEIRKQDRERQARIRKTNPEAERRRLQRFKEKKERQLVEIAGRARPSICDICGELNRRIVFDHSHACGHFRGWLCDRCNRVLGVVHDSPALLARMITYLSRSHDVETQSETA